MARSRRSPIQATTVIGLKFGTYEVVAKLGEGGMGEVYRARDTRLNRTVALKALLAGVAGDADRVARFEREAQLLASLNHPNIAAIHGVQEGPSTSSGQAQGTAYLVLEFVDGRTLADVIRDGKALAPGEAVAIARQIVEAIVAAHEKGIIHRDLKPGNVMVTADGQVKVLDFGLGKALDPVDSMASATGGSANSPTMTLMGTQHGMILGTAGYMSPEQAKGRAADKRSDVWAFGCVLFEMLSGRRAFEGEDVTETLAAIVRGEPDWSALPPTTPPALRTLIERCLVKDRAQRPDMSVVRYILSAPADVVKAASPKRTIGWLLVGALVVAAVAATLAIQSLLPAKTPPPTAAGLSRFTIVLPPGDELGTTNMAPLAISPQGTSLAYVAIREGKQQLFVREFADAEPRALPGTDGARSPFFSPDGRWIGFFSIGKLRKITLAGTGVKELADAPDTRGGTWSVDDRIYFAPRNTSGLMQVSASGGQPAVELTKPDRAAGEISHRWPYVLPDGKSLLFAVWTGPGSDEHRIERLNIADRRREVLVTGVDGPFSILAGHLIHGGRLDGLLAIPWQTSQAAVRNAEPVVLPMRAKIDNEGALAYAVSENGTFAFLQGADNRRLARVVWIDRAGKTEELPLPHRDYVSASISPDGRQAVLQVRGGTEDLWVFDFASTSFTPLPSTGGSSQGPLWTTDGKFLIYRCTRAGYRNLCRRPADGTGSEERVTTKPDVIQTATSVTPDGKWVVFLESGQSSVGGADIWKAPLDGPDRTPVRLLATESAEINGQVSPNGEWLAYESTMTGRSEVWVQPFKQEGRREQVSRDGGTMPRWSRDGRELFFTTILGDAMMVAGVSGGSFATPRLLFEGRYRGQSNANTNYDIARDGRFLHIQQVQPDTAPTRIEIVLNGLAGLAVRH